MLGYGELTSLQDMRSVYIAGYTDKKNLISFLKKKSRNKDIEIRKANALNEIYGKFQAPNIEIIKTEFGNIEYREREGEFEYKVADICRIIGKSGDIYKAFKKNNEGYAEEEVVFKVLNTRTKGLGANVRYEKKQSILRAILKEKGIVRKSECKCWWCRLLKSLMHKG